MLGVGHEARRAELADGLVLLDVAGRVGRADSLRARVDATVVAAGQVGRAAAVAQADGEAGAAVAQAHADGLVLEHLAALVLGAGRLETRARVAALARQARLVGGALMVPAAARPVGRAG